MDIVSGTTGNLASSSGMDYPQRSLDQAGLFRRAQALAAGWSKGQIDRALASGELTAVRPGAFMYTYELQQLRGRDRHEVELRALLLSLDGEWHAARRSAAVLHGLPLLGPAPLQALITRPAHTAGERSRLRSRLLADLPAVERVVVRGLPTTSVARTVFDLARTESFRAALVATDGALRAGLQPAALLDVLVRHPGWPGSRAARAVADFADGRAESPLESLARVTCRERGLPLFEPQVEVWAHRTLLGRVDGLWRAQLLVFEGDGAVKFTGAGVLPALLTRHEALRDTGLDVLHAEWDDVFRRGPAWADRVRQRLADRGEPQLAPGVRLVSTQVRVTTPSTEDSYRWAA